MRRLHFGRYARMLYIVGIVASFVIAAGASKKF